MINQLEDIFQRIDDSALDAIFRTARTSSAWADRPVPNAVLEELYELVKLGPTSANMTPGRFLFVTSEEGKARLLPALAPGNVEKTKKAPVTVIAAYDSTFFEKAGHLFPLADVRPWFEGKPDVIKAHGEQNGNLQAAYLIIAARALGLAVGPMGGFDKDAVDKEFFPNGKWRSLMLINLGYPDGSAVPARLPRLAFDEAAIIV